MPRRSSILKLPEALRRELNSKLVSQGFANYDGLEAWLTDKLQALDLEIKVSRSAIHRHGQEFEEKLEKLRVATEQAKAISDGSEDDAGAMSEALLRMVQTKTFDVLMDMEDGDKNIHKIGLTVARLARASVNQKKWAAEVHDNLKEVADKVDSLGKKGGLTKDVANQIRAQILGVNLNG
ncbi:MAG: terminase [Thiotrichaceae bacterium]|nr:MAG: terminase [Thiotrichaceae bacterium]